MALNCPNCQYTNPDQSTFCTRCGTSLSNLRANTPIPPPAYGVGANNQPYPIEALPIGAYAPPAGMQQQLQQPPVSMQPLAQPIPVGPGGYATPVPEQMGLGARPASIRRAFAGHGVAVMHHSWLIPGQHVQAATAMSTILEKLRQHNVANITIKAEKLAERGVAVEERTYVTTTRGVSTVFTYVAPAGQDIYISRATTVLPAISNVRVIIYAALLFIMLFAPGIISGILSSAASSANPAVAFGAATIATAISSVVTVAISFPLGIFFAVILARSIITLIVEKDFWWFLRPNILNDFQLDDIALMEHLTDQVVQESVKELGLDASTITPPSQGYQPKRRIRVI